MSKVKTVKTPEVTGRTTADEVDMSVGGISKKSPAAVKTSGVKMRGTGAATKGKMCRGPMA
jgi:hypothetical protein